MLWIQSFKWMLAFYEILQVEQVQYFMMNTMILRWIAEILYKVLDRCKIVIYNKYIAGGRLVVAWSFICSRKATFDS